MLALPSICSCALRLAETGQVQTFNHDAGDGSLGDASMQAYCLAAAPADAAHIEADRAALLMWQSLTTPGDGLISMRLLDAQSGVGLAQGGVDLAAVCAAGSDIEHGELPLEDPDGRILAMLTVSISVCAAFKQLLARFG
jgi:hypothetical protein